MPKIINVEFFYLKSKIMDIEKQIGCGYCLFETTCKKRDPKINKAKLGCKDFNHFSNKIKPNSKWKAKN